MTNNDPHDIKPEDQDAFETAKAMLLSAVGEDNIPALLSEHDLRHNLHRDNEHIRMIDAMLDSAHAKHKFDDYGEGMLEGILAVRNAIASTNGGREGNFALPAWRWYRGSRISAVLGDLLFAIMVAGATAFGIWVLWL